MIAERMRQHVMSIAEERGVQIEWRNNYRAWSVRGMDLVSIPAIKGPISYAVALHELGHCLGRYQASQSTVIRERWAWDWAKRNAIVWTPRMERYVQACLRWYLARSEA